MYPEQDQHKFQTFKVYLFYRLALACTLFAIQALSLFDGTLGEYSPALFSWTSAGYALVGGLSLLFLRYRKSVESLNVTTFLLLTDLCAFTLMLHASGGLQSGLGYLLIINAAIASMFLQGQLAIAFASLITIMLIGETLYINRHEGAKLTQALFSAGLLGFLVFITSITFYYLTEKIKSSSQEAIRQSQFAEQALLLAQHIVTRMQTGIIVINEKNHVELINESALQMLDLPPKGRYFDRELQDISNLGETVDQWRKNPVFGLPQFHTLKPGHEIRINFASLTSKNADQTILYLEDYRAIIQQAQQLKLASLGRLTASIAHEIRNPLGAISHAAQLLRESEDIQEFDLRFTEIILQHSARVNQIIENILALSRRKEPAAEQLQLEQWIPGFVDEYKAGRAIDIAVTPINTPQPVKVDPSHLGQVLTNLFDNGLRYSKEHTGNASIQVRFGQNPNAETTFVEVIDKGPGVSQDKLQHIFEPFFTTDETGTGLGLYISRELCEINQANLRYERTDDDSSCFKISFPHHQRMT